MARPAAGAALGTRHPTRSPLFRAACLLLGAIVVLGIAAEWVAPYSPTALDAQGLFQAPGVRHWMGTDRFGRDLLSRILFGVRVSVGIAGIAITVALAAGAALGLLAGVGRGLDQLCGRVMDVFFAFPPILLAIAIAAVLGAGVESAIAAIAVVYAPLFFRVVRGSVLAESAQAYVEAAEALGLGRGAILRRHILPNAVSPVIVQTAVCLSYGILIESALSYLGVGVQPPTPSWGTILNEGKEFLALAPWVSLFPGGAIMLTVLALNVVGDGLRDSLDPRAVTR
ncbi:MAG TPA: ABC transporter permease [Methylomirabilota bacterium]|jgi:peptide/nickel transport system permease protein|nr:ABC transporter permease [Methylomirabilota bacterium]